MNAVTELRVRHDALAERLGWRYVPLSIAFWTVLWPLGLVALTVWLVRREARLRRTGAHVERRVARLLRCYPRAWRERHGDDLADLVRDALADGRGGPRMALDLAREGLATRFAGLAAPRTRATLALASCSIPLVPQGLVPLVMTFTGAPSRSWFLALYVPESLQRPVAVLMIGIGVALLAGGLRLARTLRRQAAC
jgi:hypothetical protein